MLGLLSLFLLAVVSAVENHTTYIVVFSNDMSFGELNIHLANTLGDVQPTHVYKNVLKGFAAPLSPDTLISVQKHPKFLYYEEDQIVHISETTQSCAHQTGATWGITRVSQRKPNEDGNYYFPEKAASGVVAYIVDTGIYIENVDFQGRAKFGFKADSKWSNSDGNGHGTHVASTVGGRTYGVAKKVSLVAVKVLGDDGSGTTSGVIAGVDWAVADFIANGNGRKGVANLSLGGSKSTLLNNAVNAAMQAGLFMVVAAGNDNGDACNGSPSSANLVITVGATDIGVSGNDVRSYFSNWGNCVDIFAPGSDITAAWRGSPEAIRTISGTSMASPHVCGVAALTFGDNPHLSTTELKARLIASATSGVITMSCSGACGATKNLLVFNGCSQ